MNDPLLSSDNSALKILFDTPIYVLKEDKSTSSTIIEPQIEPTIDAEKVMFKGSFAKKLLFIISGDELRLSENDWELFNKTITALKLSNDDIAIIEQEIDSPIKDLDLILNELSPNKTVIFGKVTANKNSTGYAILRCETLKNLSEKKELKIEWWNSLKTFLS